MWEGAGDWSKPATYWPPLLWPSALCLSCSPVLINLRPGGSAFCWVLAFSTTSCHQRVSKLNWGSWGPLLLSGGFLYHILSPTRLISDSLTSCLTELYNSSITYSIAHSIFGMACLIVDCHQAEITVIQFRGHSLPVHQSMSVSWAFTLSHFVSQIRLRDFFS